MAQKRFLDPGSPIVTTVTLLKGHQLVRITNPEKMSGDKLLPGTFGRIHSQKNGVYTVWLLEDSSMNTIMIEVPLHLMGQFFKQQPHQIFPHLG